MMYFIESILSEEECKRLAKRFDIDKRINPSSDEKDDTGNSYGFRATHSFNNYLAKLKSKILEFNATTGDLKSVNAYVREYRNNDFLVKHVDRKNISITMSICLETTITKEWPLCAQINNTHRCFSANVGDGVLLFNADKVIHWRDPLICGESERVLQLFLHWTPVDYIAKKTKTII